MAGMADRIVEARKAMKMVQEALAEKVGVTQRTVSRWEKGETIPARSDMERLAGALGVEKWGVLLKDDEGIETWRKLYKSATGYTVGDDMVISWRQEKLAQVDRFVRSLE